MSATSKQKASRNSGKKRSKSKGQTTKNNQTNSQQPNPPSSHSENGSTYGQEVTESACAELGSAFGLAVTLLITLVTLAVRVYYVTRERSLWILHPDEIYQALEVAHTEAYGYGFRTYEFQSPAKGSNISLYQQKEQELGMYAMRSPVFPHFYVIVTWLAGLLGLSSAPFVIWRVAHVIVSSLLPLAVYDFTSSIFRSRVVAVVAAVLVAVDVHLSVLGTHTLVHSLLSPAIFFSLAELSRLLGTQSDASSQIQATKRVHKIEKNIQESKAETTADYQSEKRSHEDNRYHVKYEDARPVLDGSETELPSEKKERGHAASRTKSKNVSRLWEDGCLVDKGRTACLQSFNLLHHLVTSLFPSLQLIVCFRLLCRVVIPGYRTHHQHCTHSGTVSNNGIPHALGGHGCSETVGRTQATCNDSSNNKVCKANVQNSGNVSSKADSKPENAPISLSEAEGFKVNLREGVHLLISGLSLSLACYIRPDTVLFPLLFLAFQLFPEMIAVVCKSWTSLRVRRTRFGDVLKLASCSALLVRSRRLIIFIAGGFVGLSLGIMEDFHFYEVGIFSPVNWFHFNSASGTAGQVFGSESADFYLKTFMDTPCMIMLGLVNLAGFLVPVSKFMRNMLLCSKDLSAMKQSSQSETIYSEQLHPYQSLPRAPVKDNSDCQWVIVSQTVRLAMTAAFLLAVYSMQPHKELRFIHHVIVVYLIMTSANLCSVIKTASHKFGCFHWKAVICVSLVIFSISSWESFPTPGDGSLKNWVFRDDVRTHDVMKCVTYISSQNDVKGVFYDVSAHAVGGYTLLRHNVPILTLNVHPAGYHEHDLSSRTSVARKLGPVWTNGASSYFAPSSSSVSYVADSRVSNLFLSQNRPGLLLHLLEREHFNYLMLKTSEDLLTVGYKEVFKTDTFKVLKRIGSRKSEEKLRGLMPRLTLHLSDPSVLYDEGKELHSFGLFDLSRQRHAQYLRLKNGT